MKNNNHKIFLLSAVLALSLSLVIGAISLFNKNSKITNAVIPSYTLEMNDEKNKLHNNVDESTPITGSAEVTSNRGTELGFGYTNLIGANDYWHLMAPQSSFYNEDIIHGISNVNIRFDAPVDNFKIYWSYEGECTETGSYSTVDNTYFSCHFHLSRPNYFKVVNDSENVTWNILTVEVVFECMDYNPADRLSFELSSDESYYIVSQPDFDTHVSGAIAIPRFHNGLPVKKVGTDGFVSSTELVSVILPYTIDEIRDRAFVGCVSLENINIPSLVSTIGKDAFYGCTSLEHINLPNSLTSIGRYAFGECYSLTYAIIPSSLNTISDGMFYKCSSLKSVTIPNTVEIIEADVFAYCSSLKSVTIPNGVTIIGQRAFEFCTSLENISGLGSITELHDNIFTGCPLITEITIPNTVTTFNVHAFWKCESLTVIHIDENNTGLASYDGAVYTKNLKKLLYCPEGKTQITFPSGLTTIGERAFDRSNITTISLPSTLTTIDREAFQYSSKLTSIAIPNSITRIEEGTFDSCTGLKSVTLPSNLQFIGELAFYGCSSLESITIPSTVNEMVNGAFYNCTSLRTVTYNSTILDQNMFNGCTSLQSFVIKSGTTVVPFGCFMECSSLTSVTIPNTVTRIDGAVFRNCTALATISFQGTTTQWKSITLGANWNLNIAATKVTCTNGTVKL